MNSSGRWEPGDQLFISLPTVVGIVIPPGVDKARLIAMETAMTWIEMACYGRHNQRMRAQFDLGQFMSKCGSPSCLTQEEVIAELQRRYALVEARVWVEGGYVNIDPPSKRFVRERSRTAHMGTSGYRRW